jgi:hypothetical protein
MRYEMCLSYIVRGCVSIKVSVVAVCRSGFRGTVLRRVTGLSAHQTSRVTTSTSALPDRAVIQVRDSVVSSNPFADFHRAPRMRHDGRDVGLRRLAQDGRPTILTSAQHIV